MCCKQTFIKLSNGFLMPQLGLGTWRSSQKEVCDVVKEAIDVGYRHFDCAYAYENEKEVGDAIREKILQGKVSRDQIFITSKLWNTKHERSKVIPALMESLRSLGLQYVDLYLVHWPLAFLDIGQIFPKGRDGKYLTYDHDYLETWRGMEDCVNQGLARSIGLSNFNCNQIQNILYMASIRPVNNQIESHPYLTQCPLLNYCTHQGISVTAFSPLGKAGARENKNLLGDWKVMEIAKKYCKTTAQVVIRFQIQRGVVVIPKTVHKERLKSNFDVFDFELSYQDMQRLNSRNINLRFSPFLEAAHAKDYPFRDFY